MPAKKTTKKTLTRRQQLARQERKALETAQRWVADYDVRYLRSIPKSVPAGRAVVHNRVVRSMTKRLGVRGFRAWTQLPQTARLSVCSCGWAPSLGKHYRVKPSLIGQPDPAD